MNIGNKIRELRKKRGLTQEQLSAAMGVSFQAVSKWENNITLPDITLMPSLAGYFGISMDELFDFSLAEIEKDVEKIAEEAYKYRESEPNKSRKILEEGLLKYPDNEILLNNLLYVVFDPDESIKIAGRLAAETEQADIRYDALRFLAYAYKKKGDIDSAYAAIEQIPEIYFTKLTEIAYLFDGKQKYDAAEKQKWISFENLLQMMEKLAEYYAESGYAEKAKEERKTALEIIGAIKSKSFKEYTEFFKKKLGEA